MCVCMYMYFSNVDTDEAVESFLISEVSSLTLGAHAQRGLRYLLCVSVCLSVTALAATAFVSACNQRHLRHCFRLVDFRKSLPFKSYGEKKPICK